jgi:phytoene dehydrogenase-like protein
VRGTAVTLPVELLQRRPHAERYDVAVVGAGIGGLVCAGVLAQAGVRVVLLDRARRPGGRVQTVAQQGFAVDLAPILWDAGGLRDALAAAGVRDLALADVGIREELRVAVVAGGSVSERDLSLPVPGAVPSPSTLDAVRVLYGVPPRAFSALGSLYEEVTRASDDQVEGWRDTTLDSWLAERGVERVVAGALRRSVTLLGGLDPGSASLAALAARARLLSADARPTWIAPADNPVAGARSIAQALVDAVIEFGGEIRLGTRVMGLHVEGGRVRALAVQREEVPFLDEVVADRVVLALPPRALLDLLPAGARPAVEAAARRDRRPVVGVAFAFRSLPAPPHGERLTSVVRLVGPVADSAAAPGSPTFPVTLVWPTVWAPRIAPPGQGLLIALAALPEGPGLGLGEVSRLVLLIRSAVLDLHADAREAILWERPWLRRDAMVDPFAIPSVPATVASLENLLVAGASVTTPGAHATGATAAALSGRAAAERILAPAASPPPV